MSHSRRGIASVLIAIITGLLLAAGYVFYYRYVKGNYEYDGVRYENGVPMGASSESDQLAQMPWKTYRNERYGVSFKYPDTFSITDKVQSEYKGHPQGFNWYRMEFAGPTGTPWMRFEIDPDGYGPLFPDKRYVLEETAEGRLKIVKEEIITSEFSNDGTVLIIPEIVESRNGHSYYWQFSFPDGGTNYEPLFKETLASFTLLP